MKLESRQQCENTRRKLDALRDLIRRKEASPERPAAYELSLKSLKATERKLQAEIEEYEVAMSSQRAVH